MTHAPFRHFSLLAALVLAISLLAGCGGDEGADQEVRSEEPAAVSARPAEAPDAAVGGPDAGDEQKKKKKSRTGARTAAKKPPRRKPAGRSVPKRPPASSREKREDRAGEAVSRKVRDLAGGGGTRVVSSPKEIRKVLKELKEPPGGQEADGEKEIEDALDDILGDRAGP